MRPIAEVLAYLTAIDAPVTFPADDDEVCDWARVGVWEDRRPYVKKLRAIRGLQLIDWPPIGLDDGVASIVWTERGGPVVKAPTAAHGFGSQLLTRIMTRHFAGSVDFDWEQDGLIATLRIPAERLGV